MSTVFQRLLKEMEELLGCWRSLLLPLSSNPELSQQAQHLCSSLSAKGVKVDEDTLKVCLSFCLGVEWGGSPQMQPIKVFKCVCSPSSLRRRCCLKMTSEDLVWGFPHSGTPSVTISFTQLCLSSQTERSLMVTLFSS